MMLHSILPELDRILASGNRNASLDFLIEQFKTSKRFELLFEALLMKTRLALGVPLVQTDASANLSGVARDAYDQAMIDAARQVGELFLAEGKIDRAWPYFRAVGDVAPITAAIDAIPANADLGDQLDSVIAIAFQDGVHPVKGLELILERHGMCRAITSFGMYPVQNNRAECIKMLVRGIHDEVRRRMTYAIESQEGYKPEAASLLDLWTGRDWLFGDYDYYVDTSHLTSLLPYSLEVTDDETLQLCRELCEYGKRLSSNFQYKGQPPFQNSFEAYGHYIQALRGVDVDEHAAYFEKIVAATDFEEVGPAPAHVLINLLVRLGRYERALEVSLAYLSNDQFSGSACPSALQLCYLSGNFARLKDLARERGDLLSYTAASLSAA